MPNLVYAASGREVKTEMVAERILVRDGVVLSADEDAIRTETQIQAEARQRRVWWPILAALCELETDAGNIDATQQYHQQDQEIITYIADRAGSDELRALFWALQEVKALSGPTAAR